MLVPILPVQPEYESAHIRALFNKESLLITQEKVDFSIYSQVITNSVYEGDDFVRVHMIKCMDKNMKPHYLLVANNRLFRAEYANLEAAFIMKLLKEVDAKYVVETSADDYEVDDSVMKEYGKPGLIQRGLDGLF